MEAGARKNTIALHNKAEGINLRWLGSRDEARQHAEDCYGWVCGHQDEAAADSLKEEKREGETLKKDTELQKHRSLLIILEVIPNSSVSFIRCLRVSGFCNIIQKRTIQNDEYMSLKQILC